MPVRVTVRVTLLRTVSTALSLSVLPVSSVLRTNSRVLPRGPTVQLARPSASAVAVRTTTYSVLGRV